MKKIYSLITCIVLLALVAGTTKIIAQAQTPDNPSVAQSPATPNTTFAHFFLEADPTTSTVWWHSHTVVDASGGVHITFYDSSNIYYAHCSAGCSNPANWLELPLFLVGELDSLDEPTLGVDPNGHPRLFFYADYSGNESYFYAECNANCTASSSNWTSVAIADLNGYGYPQNVRYATLDSLGHPRLVFSISGFPDSGFYYLTCEANCTNASNWLTTTVDTPDLLPDVLQLVFDTNNRPRVLGYDEYNSQLVYAECNSNCSNAANWGSVGLFTPIYYMSEFGFTLRVDSQGHPRIAYYDGHSDNNVLNYAWSNASPLTPAGWHHYTLNYPTDFDYLSLDMSIDSQDRPMVTFATDNLDLSMLTCTANCETTSSTWQQQYIEKADDLNLLYPFPTNPDCQTSSWIIVGYPSISLDAADNPNVSYWVRHAQFLCLDYQGHYQTLYDAKSILYAAPAGGGHGNHRVYLPLAIRD
jgi:hypothetical protein